MNIVIPWRDRVGYLTICLATLREALREYPKTKVSLYNNESKYPLPKIVDDMEESGQLSVIELPGDDCHHVFIDMFNHAFEKCDDDHIINMDSDCCVHPSFMRAVIEMIRSLPDLGHASLYSEGNHPEPTEIVNEIYHRRPHISMTASVISRKAWSAFKKPKRGEQIRFGCIDGAFSTFVHEEFRACYSTVRSYVEHIGAVGAYSGLSHDGTSSCHRARRFLWLP